MSQAYYNGLYNSKQIASGQEYLSDLFNVALSSASTSTVSTGSTAIGTTANNGLVFRPRKLIVTCNAVAAFSAPFSFSVGSNATNYNNILSITAATGLDSANEQIEYILSPVQSIASNTQIRFNVTTAATAGLMLVQFKLVGNYE